MERISQLEQEAIQIYTPCGAGRMIWRIWGQGEPLILLHGGYGSWLHWVTTIIALKDKRTLYVPDLPGLGDSDLPEAPCGPQEIAQAIMNGLVHLGLDTRLLDMVAFSFGALISGSVANLGPLRSLTLVGASGLDLPRPQLELEKENEAMQLHERRHIQFMNLSRLMFADASKVDELAMFMQATNVARARLKSRRYSLSNILSEAVKTAQVETLNAIWGELDSTVGPYMNERRNFFKNLNRPGAFYLIPGAGHWVNYEAADQFHCVLTSILSGDRIGF